jgi:signal transduction histidine kinase
MEPHDEKQQPAQGGAANARSANKSRRDSWSRLGSDVMAGARTAAPVFKRVFGRTGDWLATIGWGKFFLVALLLLSFGGIAGSLLFDHTPAVVIDRNDRPPLEDPVNVTITVSDKGVTIGPSPDAKAPKPPKPPKPPKAPRPQGSSVSGDSGIVIDDKGVRIVTDKDGRKVVVSIDEKGVRIDDGTSAINAVNAVKAEAASGGGKVVLPPEAAQDPEKMEEAIEAARSRIEDIVNEQVAHQVARRTRVLQEQSSDWLMTFIVLLILTGIIVKVVLGSKKKAETRAQAATATAAEEGLKRQLAEAQLKMMQAQVEPHFLFNTLASVDFLIETDPPRASKMQKNLIAYLRSALPQMREGSTTLGKEIGLCRSYLEILKVRMDDRLQFAITVPQGLSSAQFPPMILQSLVENAIKHGLEPKTEGGSLTLTADIANGNLRVTVADTGLGFGAASRPGTGVGLANVRERLAALYGGGARLVVETNTPTGTIATIEVPYSIDSTEPSSPSAGMTPQPA